jgi:[NiFe] hydrogenase assembly HybE family chaperone
MSGAEHSDDHPRVLALVAQFRDIGARMRELPVYNATIAIEAYGFRPFRDRELTGVLITPWFMNLILLPIEPVALDMRQIGRLETIELPAGRRTFVVGGEREIGLYKAHSLHSPVLNFTLPGQARAEARRMLDLLMHPPEEHEKPAGGLDRRTLFVGRR